jgi:hypothetical protein
LERGAEAASLATKEIHSPKVAGFIEGPKALDRDGSEDAFWTRNTAILELTDLAYISGSLEEESYD